MIPYCDTEWKHETINKKISDLQTENETVPYFYLFSYNISSQLGYRNGNAIPWEKLSKSSRLTPMLINKKQGTVS